MGCLQVDSRIVIDTYAWNRFNPNSQVSLSSLKTKAKQAPVWDSEASDNSDEEYCDDVYDDEDDEDDDDDVDLIAQLDNTSTEKTKVPTLTDDLLLICSASLKGYSLRNKKWLTFFIGFVKEIKYNDGAFDSLVLPDDHKELILALTESQIQNKETFDDVIQGKGKGIIMLLSGPPGVGKTLTAESGKARSDAVMGMLSKLEANHIIYSCRKHACSPLHDECRRSRPLL